MSRKAKSQSSTKKLPWQAIATIVAAVLGLIGTVIVVIIQTNRQTNLALLTIRATQTAEARLTLVASSATPTPSMTGTSTPAITPTPSPTEMLTNTPTLTPSSTPTPSPTTICPTEPPPKTSTVEPMITFYQVKYCINNGPPQIAENHERIMVKVGYTIAVTDVQFHSPTHGGQEDVASVEAYMQKGRCWTDIDYIDSRTTGGGVEIRAGIRSLGPLIADRDNRYNPTWTIQPGWKRIIIALVHNYGGKAEVDDRFFINLVIQE
jgi:hypothetical protein